MSTAAVSSDPARLGPVPAAARTRTAGRPAWVRPSVAVLLVATAALYLWNLSASGYANDFYAMAVQAGTKNWEALFFGSLDPGNVITVDKPPASLWLMALSGRLLGFSSFSMLLPNALCGVASVALLHAAVRRTSGPLAGLLAGAALALTPVAALMFKFNNPDALLVLLMVAGAYCTVRALDRAGTGWLLLAGVALGFGFLTKMLQAFLVLPAFALVYLVAAPAGLGKRVLQLAGAGIAVVVAAGWWIVAVALWPTESRPYIGGSTDNTPLELAFGYNGLSRIFGGERNAGGGFGGGNAMFGGETGLLRMFGSSFGLEISWLLPAALVALVAGLWFTRFAPRLDRSRAALLLWGGWTVVTALVFSFMSGTIHPYYTVALAPGIAGLVAIGAIELWRGRHNFAARIVLALMVAATGVWDFILLDRTPEWQPWLRWVLLPLTAAVVAGLLFGLDRIRRAGIVLAVAGVCTGLLAPAAYTVVTAGQGHSGSLPTSGPSGNSMGFGGGVRGGPTSSELIALLKQTTTKWSAATNGSQSAAGLALNSDTAVIAIGGFNGGDPAPTLEQFKRYVADGDITYYVSGGAGGTGRGGSGEIATWVEQNFTPQTIGGTTVYDLTSGATTG
ncbi:ArnT family glycosyltransferase [Amycolatopsis thermophila]|uniref:4-amino-4-deoxy-L-arabinose transferase-like glycosyltransferase n=1 Tax=Amycolatopsis thermophila TaxID=206084 RepID=A0ABU0ETK4_9PSEU|nr:glycosyltransferase family 39 protein [Amycolatopsis thermophila]MDQ0378635.1 4-amino-4-deoxy-L-arabinose transferase-like glycosyltransferase [Amycolatopsis thermophila]